MTSIDGATAIDGVSGGLGSTDDRAVFNALRGQADVIIAGSATANAEGYRLPREPGAVESESRKSRGQLPLPRLCVVSRSLNFDPNVPFLNHELEDRELWPIIATTEDANSERKAELSTKARILEAGETSVDPVTLIEDLSSQGLKVSLCEGGPTLLATFTASGVVDEHNVTTAFAVAGGDSKRMASGSSMFEKYRLDRLLLGDEAMFARYLRA